MSVTTGRSHSAIDPSEVTRENVAELLQLDPGFWEEEDYVGRLAKIFDIRRHATYVGEEVRDDNWRCRHWRVMLRNRYNGRQTRADYYTGVAIKSEPTEAEVLWSLIQDADAVEGKTFEEFCADYGLNTDSRRAYKLYGDCGRVRDRMERFFGEQFELFVYGPIWVH